MKDNIINKDKNGNKHGEQIIYYPNGNIWFIRNYNYGKYHGYSAWFKSDNSIHHKEYFNMDKLIYEEAHYHNQIQIKV